MTINEHLMSSIAISIMGTNTVNKTWHQHTVFVEFWVNHPNPWEMVLSQNFYPRKIFSYPFLNTRNRIFNMRCFKISFVIHVTNGRVSLRVFPLINYHSNFLFLEVFSRLQKWCITETNACFHETMICMTIYFCKGHF